MKALHLVIMAVLGLSVTLAHAEERFLGSCDPGEGESAIYRRFDLYSVQTSLDGSEKLIEVRGCLADNCSTHLKDMAAYSWSSIKEDSSSRLEIRGRGLVLEIDHQNGTGRYKHSSWGWSCEPGESEWCMIKVPTRSKTVFRFKNCKVDFRE